MFDKVKSAVVVLDKAGRIQLVYTAPVVRHSSNKTSTPDLEWDPASSLLSVVLPDTSFPLVIAFGVGAKLPEVKGGFSFSFPSLKLKGEGESSDSESDDDEDGKKAVGFGFNVKVPRFGKGNEKEKDIAKSKGAKASTSAPKIKVFSSYPSPLVLLLTSISVRPPRICCEVPALQTRDLLGQVNVWL